MVDLFAGIEPFVAVAEERSFRAAATRLGVTSAAVSKAVRRLEAELGVALLHRTTRRVSLSVEGELLFSRARAARDLVVSGREEAMAGVTEPRGPLRVSLPALLAPALARHLPRFVDANPAVALGLVVTDRLLDLVADSIDVALRVGELADSSLVARRVASTSWVTVASPDYLARHGQPATPAELARHRCLKFRSARNKLVEWTFARSPSRGTRTGRPSAGVIVPSPCTLSADDGDALVRAAVAGVGICQAFATMVDDHLAAGRLVQVLEPFRAAGPPVNLLYLPEQRTSPRVRCFVDFAVAVLGEGGAAAA